MIGHGVGAGAMMQDLLDRGLSTRGEGQDTMGSARAVWAPGQPQAGPPVTKGIALSSSICLCLAAHRTLTLGWLVLATQVVGPQSWELPGKPSCWWCLILLRMLDGMCSILGTPSLAVREMWLADIGWLCSDPSSHGQLGQSLEDSVRPCSSL